MNELAWTMEFNRASRKWMCNVHVAAEARALTRPMFVRILLLVPLLKPFKTIILQFVIRLANEFRLHVFVSTKYFFFFPFCICYTFHCFGCCYCCWFWMVDKVDVARALLQLKLDKACETKSDETTNKVQKKKYLNKSLNSTRAMCFIYVPCVAGIKLT